MTETEHPWLAPDHGWLDRIAAHLQASGAHPARTVVLLPYAQLMPLAGRLWSQRHPNGFAPRFETTQNWCHGLGGFMPGATDLSFDAALDSLTAQALLESAGMGERTQDAAPLLRDAAWQLAFLAAAVAPSARAAWGERMQVLAMAGMESPALRLESRIGQVAVAWAANSVYVTDRLFQPAVVEATDSLIVLSGFQVDPLMGALQQIWGARMVVWRFDQERAVASSHAAPSLHACRDVHDEAQCAAAAVLRHVESGRVPVALPAIDRALTRRVRAMLESSGLALRDETGWKLSTSRAGAHVMSALRACARHASSDQVLDWLKQSPRCEMQIVSQLEVQMRRQPRRDWRFVPSTIVATDQQPLTAWLEEVETRRSGMVRPRRLSQWVQALRDLLQQSGQWALLEHDVAGAAVLTALRLQGPGLPLETLWQERRLSLSEFTRWVDQAMEGASFKPDYPEHEQVVILPLAQMLGRDFAAVVIPGCDEIRLNPSPEPAGFWTATQRINLGLPTREVLAAQQQAAWLHALERPHVALLWRVSDDGGEPLLPSPLVQQIRTFQTEVCASDPRAMREVQTCSSLPPAPCAQVLPVRTLSASAYQDLRHCPYRFFALRQLGLQASDELEVELDKRDFGLWLHAVLRRFHEQLEDGLHRDLDSTRTLLDRVAAETSQAQGLSPDEFLPFQAAWPQLRDGYLNWLQAYQSTGLAFVEGECWQTQSLGEVTLVGRLDRLDRDAAGQVMVIDYKTEAQASTARRLKEPLEDTQLAFYAALLPQDTLRAAYLNVGEREGTRLYEQQDVVALRDTLIEGIRHDLRRMAAGTPLPALGAGDVCEYCAARGLCRRDFWSEA